MVIVDVWDRCCTMGRTLRTKEILPDFREECRVTRRSRIFRGLTGCQLIPRLWGVAAWYQCLGIRIPRELGFGYSSPLGWFDVKLGMRLPRKSQDKTRTLHACVWCVLCDLINLWCEKYA